MTMTLIAQVVNETLTIGYLTEKAEQRIQRLFDQTCALEDINALEQLQQALIAGQVKRQAEQANLIGADPASFDQKATYKVENRKEIQDSETRCVN